MANDEVKEKREDRLVVGKDTNGPTGSNFNGDNSNQTSDDVGSESDNLSDIDSFGQRVDKIAARTDKVTGSVLDDKIEIMGLIGKGGMSSVYKARHLILDQIVAVKIMHPHYACDAQAVLRFQREAKAAFAFQHENLVSVHDIGTTPDGLPYFVMDYIEGKSLADELENGPLELPRAMEIFRQVCAGLEAAHKKNVVHRDIKSSNILLCTMPDGTEKAKIADFGIAKVLTQDTNQIQKLTQTGEVFGSPLYMSPEQCIGKPADQRSDIYSFGCVMYECLKGETPHSGATAFDTLSRHLNDLPKRLVEVPDTVNNAVLCCLEKRPEDRYQTVEELERDLFGDQITRRARQRLLQDENPKTKWMRRGVFAIVMFVFLLSATFLIAFWSTLQPLFNAVLPHEETEWQSLSTQAHSIQNIGPTNYDSARILYTRAIKAAEEGNAPSIDLERIYRDLARLCNQQEDWKNGIKYFNKALELSKAHSADFDVASMHDWLGDAYKNNGQYKEAIEHGKLGVELKKQLLGPQHQLTLYALLHLGQAYRLNGNLREAEATNQEAVDVAKKNYPDRESPNLADAYLQLGNVQSELGKWDAAINNYKESFDISSLTRGREHKLTIKSEDILSRVANAHGRGDEINKFIEQHAE